MIGSPFLRPASVAMATVVEEARAGRLSLADVLRLVPIVVRSGTPTAAYKGMRHIASLCCGRPVPAFTDHLTEVGSGASGCVDVLSIPVGYSRSEALMRVTQCGCQPGAPPQPQYQAPPPQAAPPTPYVQPTPGITPPVPPGVPQPPPGFSIPGGMAPPAVPGMTTPPFVPPAPGVTPVIPGVPNIPGMQPPAIPGIPQIPGVPGVPQPQAPQPPGMPAPRQGTEPTKGLLAPGFMSGAPFAEIGQRGRLGATNMLTGPLAQPTTGDDTAAVLTAYRTAMDALLGATTQDLVLPAATTVAMMRSSVMRVLERYSKTKGGASNADDRAAIVASLLCASAVAGDNVGAAIDKLEAETKSGNESSHLRKVLMTSAAILDEMSDVFEDSSIVTPGVAKAIAAALREVALGNDSPRNIGFWAKVAKAVAIAWAADYWMGALSGGAPVAWDTYGRDDEREVILRLWTSLSSVLGAREPSPDTEISASEKKEADKAIEATRAPRTASSTSSVGILNVPVKHGGGVAGKPTKTASLDPMQAMGEAGKTILPIAATAYGGPAAGIAVAGLLA